MFNKFYTHADGTPSSTIVAENLVRIQEHKPINSTIVFRQAFAITSVFLYYVGKND